MQGKERNIEALPAAWVLLAAAALALIVVGLFARLRQGSRFVPEAQAPGKNETYLGEILGLPGTEQPAEAGARPAAAYTPTAQTPSIQPSSPAAQPTRLSGEEQPAALPGSPAGESGAEGAPSPTPSPELDFYVAVDGSDAQGDGSREKPWKSITYAVKKIPDGARLLVLPGSYKGAVILERKFKQGVTLQSLVPYSARLRNQGRVVSCDTCAGITIAGFDIAHLPGTKQRYVIQIQDLKDDGAGGRRITLRNNIIHDSYNNDLIKVNNGAEMITIEGNIFYNMGGPEIDNHLDVNSVKDVTIQDNIFFNCFECSGRTNPRRSGHFIVIKDSNGKQDGISGSHDILLRRNIFLNWQGIPGGAFIGIGDGQNFRYYQAYNLVIENNLMLGNSPDRIHAAIKIDGGKDIIFRNNTVSGDLPGRSYAVRLNKSGSGLPNVDIRFYNNIWSDPTGTMVSKASEKNVEFSDSPVEAIESLILSNNLYWNGERPVPFEPGHLFNYVHDGSPLLGNPFLKEDLSQVRLPFVDEETNVLADGSETIRMAFIRLVQEFGAFAAGSPAIDSADLTNAPEEDILGRPRPQGNGPDIGAWEWEP